MLCAPARSIGLAGLLGSGSGRIIRALFGVTNEPTPIRLGGRERRLKSPADAIAAGIGMVPGERSLGLVMNQSVRDNILLPNLDALSRMGWIDRRAGDRIVAELMELVDIRPRRPQLRAGALSGGNQQKVILAKWLARRVAVLLLDEPTQGIDVAAKAQIHALIRDFVARGGGALIHSSDLAELARLCDAVLAVRQGRIARDARSREWPRRAHPARGDRGMRMGSACPIYPRHPEVAALRAALEGRRPECAAVILRGPRRRGHLRMTAREISPIAWIP